MFRPFLFHSSFRFIRTVFVVLSLIATISVKAAFPFNINGVDPAKVGIMIYDLRGDSVVMDHNGFKWLIPASVMKSVTSAAVLCTKNADDCFTTSVVIDGKIKKSSLDGNLVIECCGDPTIESSHFPENTGLCNNIVAALVKAGIKEIKGKIIIKQDDFADAGYPDSWVTADLLHTYGAGLYAANYKDNTVRLTLPAGTLTPTTPSVSVQKNPSKNGLSVSRARGSKTFVVSGKIGSYSDSYANPDPASSMEYEITRAILDAGIIIGNETLKGGKHEVLYNHVSPAYRDILHSLMIRSDNMMAEGMLRSVEPGGTRADAIEHEIGLWTDAGLPVDNIVIEDGSGLSRNDRLSPLFLTELYRHILNTSVASEYVALFPKAGIEGTMKNFLKDTPLQGRVVMKTGSMRGIQCFGGYLLDDGGIPTHTIVVLVNDFTADRARVKAGIASLLIDKFVPSTGVE